MAKTNDTACARTNHTNHESNSIPVPSASQEPVTGSPHAGGIQDPIFINGNHKLFTTLVGTSEENRYKPNIPLASNVLQAIDDHLERITFSNTVAIEAIAKTFEEASTGYYGVDCDQNQDEAFLCEETRILMWHMSDLARQIRDNREIRQILQMELDRRSINQGGVSNV